MSAFPVRKRLGENRIKFAWRLIPIPQRELAETEGPGGVGTLREGFAPDLPGYHSLALCSASTPLAIERDFGQSGRPR